MIKRYNNISLATGVPGIILQIVGQVMSNSEATAILGLLLALVGTVLLMIGLAYYAMAKGRSPVWCLMGLLSCLGLLVLAVLKDLAPEGGAAGMPGDSGTPRPPRPDSGNPYQAP